MALSLLKISFLFIAFWATLLGTLINSCAQILPDILKKSFLYGKFSYEKSNVPAIQVPKRWFQHFYIFASLWSTLALCAMVLVFVIFGEAPPEINAFLDVLDANRTASASATSSFIAMVLLTIQSWKRLYETTCVSVFSDTKIDISHYFIGYFHYFGAVMAILIEAPGFCPFSNDFINELAWDDLKLKDIVNASIFLLASWQQLVSARILANLRKNKKGVVVSYKHCMPQGGLFEWVSSPHLMCEIVMYTAISFILSGNYSWHCVFIWVLCNQVLTAKLSHNWYQSQFKDYPKQRRAVFPFIY